MSEGIEMDFYAVLHSAEAGEFLSVPEIALLLDAPDAASENALFEAAYRVKSRICGKIVNLRGLIEFSNICTRNCFYCGIRKSNHKVSRYTMSMEEILHSAALAGEFGYGSVVLQSGERSDPAFVDFVEEILCRISQLPYELGITLSCGEESLETYRRWKKAGARRYLLRIESASEKIFKAIHPADALYSERRAALERIKTAGFQTGSGVMIGLPGQTVADLAADIDFFRSMDLDMIGMGPFIPQEDTPMGEKFPDQPGMPEKRLELSLRMIAVTRLVLRDVNIAATTALQAIDPENGRERGILAGANVIMPNVGDIAHRKDYQLYNGKPSLDENSEDIRNKLIASLERIGETARFNASGDPLHFFNRVQNK
ncbi:MAG: [FeFe] hydrogenase H-cluster radical SAM maturase HydE [Lentisphaerae bacterium]|nr:[FeFe] hydrogenase H-cluster radical SAM maturase HydE [Lentisphaerota bacterium]